MEKDKILELPIYKNKKGKYLVKKDIVTDFPNNFNIVDKGEYEYATTSGTTSDRMEIIRKPGWWKEEYERTYANNSKLQKYLDEGLHKIIFTTAQCSNLICFVDKPPMEERTIGNTLYVNNTFNPWQWTKDDIKNISKEINLFKPYYLDADPVYLGIFLYLRKKYNIKTKLHVPEIITLSYEYVTTNLKEYIKDYFKTDVKNLYGTTEFGYIFLENEEGKMAFCKDKADVKLLKVKEDLYTLIVDSYKNEYMPLLDYQVGDMVNATKEQYKSFKKDMVVEKMAGREKDLLKGNISYGDIDNIMQKIDNLLLYQFFVVNDNNLILKYIKLYDSELEDKDKKYIEKEFNKLGYEGEITFTRVKEIAPEVSGKFAIVKRGV